jgi:hypothetical protein
MDYKTREIHSSEPSTNFVELSPSWEAASHSATEELPNILWNPKVHYRVDKSPPLWSLSWARPIQSIPPQPISLRSIFISYIHLRLGLPSGLFPSCFPTNILYAVLSHSCYMPCSCHPWHDHSNYTWRSVQVMKLPIMQLPVTSCQFILLRSMPRSYLEDSRRYKELRVRLWSVNQRATEAEESPLLRFVPGNV